MADKKIHGAVSVGDKTYVAGQEEEFEAAMKAGEKTDMSVPKKDRLDKPARVDVEGLTKAGVISGFGHEAEETPVTVNRQRDADGTRADPKASERKKVEPPKAGAASGRSR